MKHNERQRVIIPGVEADKVLEMGLGMKGTVMKKGVYVITNKFDLCCKKYRHLLCSHNGWSSTSNPNQRQFC